MKEQIMTARQIADFAGCSLRSVNRAIKKLFPWKSQGRGVTRLFTTDEASLISADLPKVGVIEMGGVGAESTVERPTGPTDKIHAESGHAMVYIMSSLVEQIAKQQASMERMQTQQQEFMERVIDRLQPSVVPGPPEQLQLPQAPPKSARSAINQIVRQYVDKTGTAYSAAWNTLFSEMLYRGRVNITVKAKNRGMTRLDYAQENNHLPALLAIATDIFQAQ